MYDIIVLANLLCERLETGWSQTALYCCQEEEKVALRYNMTNQFSVFSSWGSDSIISWYLNLSHPILISIIITIWIDNDNEDDGNGNDEIEEE